jgi:hypothetical protein
LDFKWIQEQRRRESCGDDKAQCQVRGQVLCRFRCRYADHQRPVRATAHDIIRYRKCSWAVRFFNFTLSLAAQPLKCLHVRVPDHICRHIRVLQLLKQGWHPQPITWLSEHLAAPSPAQLSHGCHSMFEAGPCNDSEPLGATRTTAALRMPLHATADSIQQIQLVGAGHATWSVPRNTRGDTFT